MPLHNGLRLLPMPLATRTLPDRDEKQTGATPSHHIPLVSRSYHLFVDPSLWQDRCHFPEARETYLRGDNSLPGGFLVYLTEVVSAVALTAVVSTSLAENSDGVQSNGRGSFGLKELWKAYH